MTVAHVQDTPLLVYLRLSNCSLSVIHRIELKNLQTLDLSRNEISTILVKNLTGLANLKNLILSRNIVLPTIEAGVNNTLILKTVR